MLSVLAIASIASTAVLGNTQTAYAGLSECTLSPIEVRLTLDKGESSELIAKILDCDSVRSETRTNPNDCRNKGINVFFGNFESNPNQLKLDETIINTDGAPGQTHCDVTFITQFVNEDPEDIQVQKIWIETTPEPTVVGGELLPIDSTALILAGAQSFSWMIPVILSGIGIGLFVVSRKSA